MKVLQIFKSSIAGAALSLITTQPALAETEAEHAQRIFGREYVYPVCYDDQNNSVSYHSRDETSLRGQFSPRYAGARFLDAQSLEEPAIVYNIKIYEDEADIALDFSFSHECYHLNSGDARQAYIYLLEDDEATPQKDWVEMIERNADCAAAIRLRDEYNYTAQDMSQLHNIILVTTSGKKAEQARLDNIEACYGEDIPFGEYIMDNN